MVLGWRRAFCTSIHKDRSSNSSSSSSSGRHDKNKIANDGGAQSDPSTPKFSSKLRFFSNPSTPRLQTPPVSSPSLRCRTTTSTAPSTPTAPESPKLRCKTTTTNSPRFFQRSNPSSPRSPSTFSLLKSTLRLSNNKAKCGICLQNVKSGQGMAIFTAECSHSFHFPCVAGHVRNQEAIRCPVCNSPWTEMPLLSIHNVSTGHPQNQMPKLAKEEGKKMEFPSSPRTPTSLNQHTGSGNGKPSSVVLKVYNDDEPLMSPTCGARFNPIPESDECDEDIIEEFQGFQTTSSPLFQKTASTSSSNVESRILPESAVLSVSRNHQTLVVVLKIKAPPAPLVAARRAPIDLVTVIDVSGKMTNEKLQMVRRSLRLVVSSMSAADRLSIVAFSSTSKRLLPLRRMTTAGRRSARRIVDAIVALDGTAPACANDALKKAVKVLEDRREKNPVASIILLSDSLDFHRSHNQRRQTSTVYTTRITHLEVPAVAVGFNPSSSALDQTHPVDDGLPKCIGSLLCVMVQDLRVNLGFIPGGSNQAEILGVYSYAGRAAALGSGVIRLGELFAEEERELLVELKVPSVSSLGPHHVLSVRCSYKDPSTQELIQGKEQPLLVPRPRAVRSTTPTIERLRSLFVATRAVAESRRLVEKSDLAGAYQMLSSARNMVLQAGSGDEVVRGLEAELAELHWRRQQQNQVRRRQNVERRPAANLDEKSSEPLTPTSAWRAAERLAKVAIMRKSMNRVSDLHGFENARF